MSLLGFVAAVLGPLALLWRQRFPLLLAAGTAALSLVLPLGNTLPYIALAALIGRRRGQAIWLAAGLTALTSTWVVVSDGLAQPRAASFLKTLLQPEGAVGDIAPVGATTLAVVAALGWGLSVGTGLLIRGGREAAAARQSVVLERRATTQLGDEVARQAERERIAREVHDVLGHRLSLLSLNAGAMEANAQEDERMRSSAALVRESAAGAMADLRSLLDVLRQPALAQPDLPLTALTRVVDESFGSGQLLASTIFVEDAEEADPALSRAVYRIVQELLTNARKHAPGQRVWLTVKGGPVNGVLIDVRNPLATNVATGQRSTRGLTGIAERAELIGGRVQYGVDDAGRSFRVRVELPWRGAGNASGQQ